MNMEQHPTLYESSSTAIRVREFGRLSSDLKSNRTGPSGGPSGWTACATSAFTMVEVAIALAVIGFALVAIIGILPAGLNVQKENREETIINQEASIWLDAIRQGAEGMDYLADYVDLVKVTETYFDDSGNPVGGANFSYTPDSSNPRGHDLTNGAAIVGLMTAAKFRPGPPGYLYTSNHVEVYVRAISGNATEKMPQNNQAVMDSAFSYQLTASAMPFYPVSDQWYDYYEFILATGGGGGAGQTPGVAYAKRMADNLHDVRLSFRWPLRPPIDTTLVQPVATNIGPGHLTFRTTFSGAATNVVTPDFVHYSWLQPGTYDAGRRSGP